MTKEGEGVLIILLAEVAIQLFGANLIARGEAGERAAAAVEEYARRLRTTAATVIDR